MMKILGTILLLGQLLMGAEIYATFTVEPQKESKLALEVAGVVRQINVDIGDKVHKGQTLLLLDTQQERLNVKLAQNALRLSNLSYKYANNSYKRYLQIKNVIDKEQFEKVELDKKLKYTSVAQATNSLKQAKVSLSKRTLKAPYNGIITAKYIEVGDGVSGTPQTLFNMISYPQVKLLLSFDQKYWKSVKVGETFKYKIDSETTQREGTIAKIYPVVDSKNRKLQAEVMTKGIMPGLFGDGQIITE